MADYQPNILQKYADDLYSRARAIIAGCGIFGFVIGVVASLAYSEAQGALAVFRTIAAPQDNNG